MIPLPATRTRTTTTSSLAAVSWPAIDTGTLLEEHAVAALHDWTQSQTVASVRLEDRRIARLKRLHARTPGLNDTLVPTCTSARTTIANSNRTTSADVRQFDSLLPTDPWTADQDDMLVLQQVMAAQHLQSHPQQDSLQQPASTRISPFYSRFSPNPSINQTEQYVSAGSATMNAHSSTTHTSPPFANSGSLKNDSYRPPLPASPAKQLKTIPNSKWTELGFHQTTIASAIQAYPASEPLQLDYLCRYDPVFRKHSDTETVDAAISAYRDDMMKIDAFCQGYERLAALGFEPALVRSVLVKYNLDTDSALEAMLSNH